ncbi:hypothetical protein L1987_09032 [Smallanthus sonchifolius]|uniref:Uncharacterized protein n=1 Tax=Smallanthus sonchifolius TaxID=185202 RepID=A0ACB9JMT5_9ASTR|nr:hypothetical protein L1987_09032 [Smallanthus sonchifolius]
MIPLDFFPGSVPLTTEEKGPHSDFTGRVNGSLNLTRAIVTWKLSRTSFCRLKNRCFSYVMMMSLLRWHVTVSDSTLRPLFKTPVVTQISYAKEGQEDAVILANQMGSNN